MIRSPAHRLIVAYGALALLVDLAVLLPGNPHYSSAWGAVAAVVIQAIVVWRLWHGSALAWFFALASAVLTAVAVFLIGTAEEVGVIVLYVFSMAQAGILCTRPIMALVWSRIEKPVPLH